MRAMLRTGLSLLLALAVVVVAPPPPAAAAPGDNYAVDDALSGPRTRWFDEARFGMFIHFGVYAAYRGQYGTCRDAEWIKRQCNIPWSAYRSTSCFTPAPDRRASRTAYGTQTTTSPATTRPRATKNARQNPGSRAGASTHISSARRRSSVSTRSTTSSSAAMRSLRRAASSKRRSRASRRSLARSGGRAAARRCRPGGTAAQMPGLRPRSGSFWPA